MTEDERRRLVTLGFDQFKKSVLADQPSRPDDPFDEAVGKVILMQADIQHLVSPMIRAGALRDKAAMEQTLIKLYLDKTVSFTREELQSVVAWMMVSTAMQGLYPETLGTKPKIPTL